MLDDAASMKSRPGRDGNLPKTHPELVWLVLP
jgi:hypothetical protein